MSASTRVLVVQPSLQPPGGGNAVAAWIIQALVPDHRVSVLTWQPIDLESANAYYGTSLSSSDVSAIEMPRMLRRSIDLLPTPSALLKSSLVLRRAKQLAGGFDLVVCGHNETDLGPRCIQYVHYPSRLRPRPAADLRWYHGFAPALGMYYRACDRIAGLDRERVREALTLANSTWTAGLLERMYTIGPSLRVLHPPVASIPAGTPWDRRENGFVCIGRIAPEKELERVIDIVGRVRGSVPDAHLHIIGSRGPARYLRRIRSVAARHGWIDMHEDVTREALFHLIASHRYAIHGMRDEHFGIAPAEAVSGGCIVFVPDGGGQVDIVGAEPRLLYSDEDEAGRKIVRVMTSPAEQHALRTYLAARRSRFTTERFVEDFRSLAATVVLTVAGRSPAGASPALARSPQAPHR